MSKMDNLRAMREARYAANAARGAERAERAELDAEGFGERHGPAACVAGRGHLQGGVELIDQAFEQRSTGMNQHHTDHSGSRAQTQPGSEGEHHNGQ